MKTERRHELGTNSLARSLDQSREWLRPYSTAILAFILLAVGAYVAATIYSSYQASANRAAWDEYQLAILENDAERLRRAATGGEFQGADMQEWAYVAWADRQLQQASELYLRDRDEAEQKLSAIKGTYEVYAESGVNPEVRNRARLGLARVNEMENRLDEARRQYELVEGALGEVAARRLERLKQKPAQESIHWLATADLPKPAMPRGAGIPGARPGLEAGLPPTDARGMPLAPGRSLEDIIGGLKMEEGDERYGEAEDQPASEATSPYPDGAQPATDAPIDAPPTETPPPESPAEAPATAPADAPATVEEATEEPPAAADAKPADQ